MTFKPAIILAAIAWIASTGEAAASGGQPQNVLSHAGLDDLENSVGLLGLLGLIGLFGLRRTDQRR